MYGQVCAMKWYDHSPPSVAEKDQIKFMWVTTVLINKRLETNQLDIGLMHKSIHERFLMDVAIYWYKITVEAKQSIVQNLVGQRGEMY